MLRALLLSCLLSIPGLSQTSDGPAKANAPCIAAKTTGDPKSFTIRCGIGKEQGRIMLDILNRILADHLDPKAVMDKLGEITQPPQIPHIVLPSLPVRTYSCDGHWELSSPGSTPGSPATRGGDDLGLKAMVRLNNAGQFQDLIKLCQEEMQAKPEWLTPRLFCAMGYLALGDTEKAKAMLAEFDAKTTPAYNVDGCKEASDFLHKRIH